MQLEQCFFVSHHYVFSSRISRLLSAEPQLPPDHVLHLVLSHRVVHVVVYGVLHLFDEIRPLSIS